MTAISPNHPAFNPYRRRVAGEKLPLHESQPEAGHYRYKTRTLDTIATIMPDRNEEGWELLCFVGPERRQMKPVEVWGYVAGRHVRPDVAKHVLETGEWPGDAPVSGLPAKAAEEAAESPAGAPEATPEARGSVVGDNAEKAGVGPLEEALSYAELAKRWIDGVKTISTETEANKAANLRDELLNHANALKAAHKVEKQPYLDKGREIDAKYLRPAEDLEALRVRIKKPLEAYLNEEDRKKREAAEAERKRLEAEAEKKRQAAIEEARARQDEEAAKQIEQVPIAALVETPMPVAEPTKVGGQRGRRTGLRKETTYVIEDYEKALHAVKNHQLVRDAVQAAVEKLMKAGVAIPGAKKVEGRKL